MRIRRAGHVIGGQAYLCAVQVGIFRLHEGVLSMLSSSALVLCFCCFRDCNQIASQPCCVSHLHHVAGSADCDTGALRLTESPAKADGMTYNLLGTVEEQQS